MRYSGVLGITTGTTNVLGVVKETVEERPVKGELLRNSRGWTHTPSGPNPDAYIRMAISILPSAEIAGNVANIRYATVMGVKWKVMNFEVQDRHYILNLGDKYE